MKLSQQAMQAYRSRLSQLDEQAKEWLPTWHAAAKQFGPDRGRDLDGGKDARQDTDGGNKFLHLLDPTGLKALRVAAAGLMSGLTPRTREWFKFRVAGDDELTQHYRVRKYLDDRASVLRRYMQTTNTYQVLHATYMELLLFGTGTFGVDAQTTTGKPWRCVPFTAGEYRLDINSEYQVDTFSRHCYWTTKQIVGRWGKDKVPQQVRLAWDEGKLSTRFRLAHLIEPNDDRMQLRDAAGRPFRSIYSLDSESPDSVLGVSGFWRFPIVSPRWDVVGSQTYGTGPALPAVGASGCLQVMERDSLRALAKMVDPPTYGNPQDIDNNPGAHNPTLPGFDGIHPVSEVRPDLAALLTVQQAKQEQVNGLLFADLFLLLANLRPGDMTAYEVAERNSEKLQILGPVLDRLETELLEAVITLLSDILDEAGLMPPAPPELEGREIGIEYDSILTQAMALTGVQGIREWAGWADQMAARRPEQDDKINWDAVTEEMGHRYSVPAAFLRDDEEVAAIRQARAERDAAHDEAELINQQAQGAATLAEVPVGDGTSVLESMLGSAR